MAGFSLLCGLAVGQAMRLDVPHPMLLALFGLLCAGWYALTRDRERAIRFFHAIRGSRAVEAPVEQSDP